MRLSIFNRHPHDEFSSYLDGELVPLRIEAMQAHLASCPSCRAELEALRELKTVLATLPEIAAPRSFVLTPEMIARPGREKDRPAPVRARAMSNGMRLAGGGMTLALVLVLVLDFTGGGTNGGGAPTSANVQEFATAQSSDSLSSAGGNAAPPTPAPAHNDLKNGSAPASFPTGTPVSGSSSSQGGAVANPSSPSIAPTPVGRAPSPAIVQTDGSSTDKGIGGTTQGSPTSAPAALNTQPSVFGAQQPSAASTGTGGGVDVLLLVALALAAGIVVTVAASFVLPRLGREDV